MKSHRSGFLIAMIFCVAAILAGVLLMAPAARTETVPPDSWAYEALKSFELRGLVALEPTFPYTFNQCEAYTREIVAAVEARGIALGPRHAFLLERLTKQFVGTRDRPEDRWSKPVYVEREGDRFAAFDVSVGVSARKNPDQKKGEADGLAVPGILVGLGHNVTLETNYRLRIAPERGRNANTQKPSARLRSYRGLTAEFERGLLDASGDWWEVRAGREYMHWGSNLREDLIVSRTAGSLDHVGARFALGRFALSTFQASLTEDYKRRHFAGHRLTAALPRGIFVGISETVVYQGDVKHRYIMPLSIFYAQQFNEGSNVDNILWALDWKVPIRRGLLFYGEFLVDDFQYERDENAGPDRLGLCVAADALLMVGERELELSGGYTYIDTYTYAHFMAGGYVAGDGHAQMNPILGSPVGPDADRRFIKATLGVSGRTAVSLEGVYTMYGANNQLFNAYLQDWAPSKDNDPAFPTAPVLHVKYVCASTLYDLRNGSFISAGGGVRFCNGGPDNIDAEEGFGWLEVVLDL
jgi:hypothetical protein